MTKLDPKFAIEWGKAKGRAMGMLEDDLSQYSPKYKQLEMGDCYLKAEPDEPKFTLLARDPIAPNLVKMWAALRSNDILEAIYQFNELAVIARRRYKDEPTQPAKIQSAIDIAIDMKLWQK